MPSGYRHINKGNGALSSWVKSNFDRIVLVASPFLLLPVIFYHPSSETDCAYVVLLMSLYWVFEVLPLAITALIPMVLFPVFGIMRSDEVAKNYLPDTGFLFIGGLMVAVAVEKSNLHTRIALIVLSMVGSEPLWILAGFMMVTCFLSMWISNTATAALMVPIVNSVISELVHNHRMNDLASLTERANLQSRRRSIEGRRLSMNADAASMVPPKEAKQHVAAPHHESMYSHPHYQYSFHKHEKVRFLDIEAAAAAEAEALRAEEEAKAGQEATIEEEPANGKVEEHHENTEAEANLKGHYAKGDMAGASMRDMMAFFTPTELRMAKGFLISICFSANIGGATTITGTASNLVLIGQLEKLFPGADTGVNFLSWMMFTFVMVMLCMICCWLSLYLIFMRNCPRGSPAVSRKLKEKYEKLPPFSWQEVAVSVCFCILLVLWIFRDPKFIAGLGAFFKKGYVTDATSVIFVVIMLFILPENKPSWLPCGGKSTKSNKSRNGLLDWTVIQAQFPWAVVLLLGGGFALAAGVKTSGLSHEIGNAMRYLGTLPTFAIMTICVLISVALTNVCSNTVVASIFIPIVAELATSLDTNPLLFMLPVTVASSFAFLLPVATPPNAIVFGSGVLEVKDMAIAGFVTTISCTLLVLANMVVVGPPVFDLATFPEWASRPEELANNATSLLVSILSSNSSFVIN